MLNYKPIKNDKGQWVAAGNMGRGNWMPFATPFATKKEAAYECLWLRKLEAIERKARTLSGWDGK